METVAHKEVVIVASRGFPSRAPLVRTPSVREAQGQLRRAPKRLPRSES